MTKKQESLTYLVLTLTVIGLICYLAYDIKNLDRGPLEDPLGDILRHKQNSKEITSATREVSSIFVNHDLLFPIVTPKPTPTKIIRPTPTPTPPPFGNWTIKGIIADMVMFTDESKKTVRKREGDSHYNVAIIEVNAKERTVTIEYMPDGRTKVLKK